MKSLQVLLSAACLLGSALASPIVAHPGTAADIVITAQDTINGTAPGETAGAASPADGSLMQIAFKNNFASGTVNGYITGSDTSGAAVFVLADGSFYRPDAQGATSPQPLPTDVSIPLGGQGSTTTITLPDYIISARVWAAVGELSFFILSNGNGGTTVVEPSQVNPQDPSADVNWGFVEFNYASDSGVFANISYVDFVGLVLGMMLLTGSGSTQSVPGLQADAVNQICSALKSQSASDGQPWSDMCVTDSNGNNIRVLSPQDYVSVNTDAFSDYWTDYVNDVWTQYTNSPLTIDTQTSAGNVNCQVSGSTLNCDGDNRGYAQPNAGDIFGCNSGPFLIQQTDNGIHSAVVPRLCAAFDRTTYLLNGGNVQPSLDSSNYYTTGPTNWYSSFVHQQEVGGLGYAFSYDDVTPDGVPSAAGTVSDGSPQVLTVILGGPSS